jgi:hypothetical protein
VVRCVYRPACICAWLTRAPLLYPLQGFKNVFLEGGKCITWFAQNRQWEVRCVRAVCVRAVCVRACVCCVCVLCVRVRRASCIVRRVCVRVVWYTHPIHPTHPSSFLLEYTQPTVKTHS